MDNNEREAVQTALQNIVTEFEGRVVDTKAPRFAGDEIPLGRYSVSRGDISGLERDLRHICKNENKTLLVFGESGIPKIEYNVGKYVYTALLVGV